MDWDREGRFWVVEMPGFVPTLQAPEPYMEPIGKIVVLEDTNRDGVMDKRTVFADGLALPRALKVLDRGVLVAEPPYAWLMRRHRRRSEDGRQGADDRLFGRREARVEQNTNDFYWAIDNWMHNAKRYLFAVQGGQVRSAARPDPRRVGRHPGRRGADLPEHQRVLSARRLRAVAVFPAQPSTGAHARQLRGAARRRKCRQRCLAGPAEPGNESRVSVRHRSSRRHAPPLHGGLRACSLPRRSAAGGTLRQHVRRGACRQPRRPDRAR